MARIDEIADLYRLSIYLPQIDLQFNHFLIKDERAAVVPREVLAAQFMETTVETAPSSLAAPASSRCHSASPAPR